MRLLRAPGGLLCGLSGDRAPVLAGGFGTELGGNGTSPVTLLLIGGRPTGAFLPVFSIESTNFSSGSAPRIGEVSLPMACLRAFSCFACTERK